jgi:hypothetical protein
MRSVFLLFCGYVFLQYKLSSQKGPYLDELESELFFSRPRAVPNGLLWIVIPIFSLKSGSLWGVSLKIDSQTYVRPYLSPSSVPPIFLLSLPTPLCLPSPFILWWQNLLWGCHHSPGLPPWGQTSIVSKTTFFWNTHYSWHFVDGLSSKVTRILVAY